MAITYRATRAAGDGSLAHYAIKCMLPHLKQDPQYAQLFIEEARTAVRLSHPNIASITDFGDVGGQLYLAMEFVQGHSLAAVLDRARKSGATALPRAEALFLGCVLCEALNYAHTKAGVVHRDVSPDNLLLGYDGVLKLIDFGIARPLGELPHKKRTMSGKYRYTSPEQARGEPADQRTDVYSAAVVVYELLTGRRPFDGDPFVVMRMAAEGGAQAPSSIDHKLAPVDDLLLQALHPVRGKRTRSVHLFLGELYQALVTIAPDFDPADAQHLMSFLFMPDIEQAKGKRPHVPLRYLMRADDWLAYRPTPAPKKTGPPPMVAAPRRPEATVPVAVPLELSDATSKQHVIAEATSKQHRADGAAPPAYPLAGPAPNTAVDVEPPVKRQGETGDTARLLKTILDECDDDDA